MPDSNRKTLLSYEDERAPSVRMERSARAITLGTPMDVNLQGVYAKIVLELLNQVFFQFLKFLPHTQLLLDEAK
jgi:hypothetical protein